MKKLWEPLKQLLILAISTAAAFKLVSPFQHLTSLIQGWMGLQKPYPYDPDFKEVVTFATPLIYLVIEVIYGVLSRVPLSRAVLDKKAMFIGTYLSLPTERDHVNVFKIERHSLTSTYGLIGYRFSLSNKHETGKWESEKLEIKTSEPPSLMYIYLGERHDGGGIANVRGFVKISFLGTRPERGEGYWIDVNEIEELQRRAHTNYRKVTSAVKKQLFGSALVFGNVFPYVRIRYFIHEPKSIFDAFAALTEAERDGICKRPPPRQSNAAVP
jgi:hypothetical protein